MAGRVGDNAAPRRDAPRLVSVIIPCRNGASTLGEQLAALAGQTYPGDWEVVFVDNGSTDASVEVASAWGSRLPALRVVRAAKRGVASVRNVGAKAARGDLLAFCDADDVVVPGWLAALVAAARDADIVGGALDDVTLNDERVVAWRGALPVGQPLVRFDYLPYAPGGNCAVWRGVFEALGGWDAAYVAGSDDADFSWRAQARGLTVAYAPDAVLQYRYRGTLRGVCRQFFRYGITEVRLYRRFRRELPAYDREDVAEVWRDLKKDWVKATGSEEKGYLLTRASYHLGHLLGSLRFRVWLP